jgi:hypothetical protein
VRRGGLLPLHGIDEVLVAIRADVEVDDLVRRAGRGLRRMSGLVLEVDDLDRTTRRENDAADVVGVVFVAHGVPSGA